MADAEIKGLPQLIKACQKIEGDIPKEMELAAHDIAKMIVVGARSNARSSQQSLAASTLSAGREGAAGTVSSVAPFFAGAEFGGRMRPTTMQFPPHRGKRGYFLYPWMRSNAQHLNDRWDKAMDEVGELWDYNPSGLF